MCDHMDFVAAHRKEGSESVRAVRRRIALLLAAATFVLVGAVLAQPAAAQVVVPPGFQGQVFATGFLEPVDIAVAPATFGAFGGHLFVSDRGVFNGPLDDSIARVSPTGAVSSFANVGTTDPGGLSFGPGGSFGTNLFVAGNTTTPGVGNGSVLEVDATGVASIFTATCCSGSGGVAFDPTGAFGSNMFVGLTGLDGIGRVTLAGVFSTFVNIGALAGGPTDIEFGPGGAFGTDMFVSVFSLTPGIRPPGVYKVSPAGVVSALADTTTSALIGQSQGLAFGPGGAFGGNLYVSDSANGTILEVDPSGTVSVFASGLLMPEGLAFAGPDTLYVVELGADQIVKITAAANEPFAAFRAKAKIKVIGGKFHVKGRFALGGNSNGIGLGSEDISFGLAGGTGGASVTIPAGAGHVNRHGTFRFRGTIDGIKLHLKIKPTRHDSFTLTIRGKDANFNGIANPVSVSLRIGDDEGSVEVTARIRS